MTRVASQVVRARLIRISQRASVAVAVCATAGTAVLWARDDVAGELALLLLAIPVALCAVAFGLPGGVLSALLALGLTIVLDVEGALAVGPAGYAAEAAALLVVGGLVGHFADERRLLERRITRHEELSLDLICTADFEGHFIRLNPAWRNTLGYEGDELLRRPFLDFVHPDDREATIAEAERQTQAGEEVLRFENRYRHQDGTYRWLEWTSRPDPEARELIAVARDVTARKEAEEVVRLYQERLEREVAERTRDLEEARLEILQRLALAAEYRDDETYRHTGRVAATAAALSEALGVADRDVALMRQAAPLHDIGKLGISDTILLKAGRLSEDEFELVKTHALVGAEILAGSSSDVLQLAERIARTHHEWWDGSGYPAGLRGSEIPLCGRVVALADVYDALTHRRPYKEAWPVDQAVEEVRSLRERQFDPDVVDAFEQLDVVALAGLDDGRADSAAA